MIRSGISLLREDPQLEVRPRHFVDGDEERSGSQVQQRTLTVERVPNLFVGNDHRLFKSGADEVLFLTSVTFGTKGRAIVARRESQDTQLPRARSSCSIRAYQRLARVAINTATRS